MAEKESSKEIERIYIVPLRRAKIGRTSLAAPRAVKQVRGFLTKHMKVGNLGLLRGSKGIITLVDTGRNLFGTIERPVTYDVYFEKDDVEVDGIPESYLEGKLRYANSLWYFLAALS